MEVASLSDDEHEAVIEALNDKIRGESWSHDTELLARAVDLLGAILAHLQSGVWTAAADPKKGKFGRPEYPDPVRRPDWVEPENPDQSDDGKPPLVAPGALAAAFAACQ